MNSNGQEKRAVAGRGAANVGGSAEQEPADHLVTLPGTRWALWRWVCLRGAGFPAALVGRLATPECAVSADAVLDAEEALRRERATALEKVNDRLDALRREAAWEEKGRREPLLQVMRALKSGKAPAVLANDEEVNRLLRSVEAASQRLAAAAAGFRQTHDEATAAVSEEIAQIAGRDDFCEAVIWQNRRAFHTAIRSLARHATEKGGRGSKQRQHEELVALYLQRYCVKNDTIGFFGPVGWARLNDRSAEMLEVRPGRHVLAARTVYFEDWGIGALAEQLAADEQLRQWAPPRRVPYVRVEGNACYLPKARRPLMLSAKQRAVFGSCDAQKSAKEIADALISRGEAGFVSGEEVYRVLETLQGKGLISWGFEFPLAPYPEEALARLLERVEPTALRESAAQGLAELQQARQSVVDAAGKPAMLDQALENLEAAFIRITGENPTRNEGQTYAARTLIYEDCRRDVEVEFGAPFLEALAAPLSLVLMSARWISYQIAQLYRGVFRDIHQKLCRETGTPAVDGMTFWMAVQPLLFGEETARPVDTLQSAFQERWLKILSLPQPGKRRIHYTTAELLASAATAFDVPDSGWERARHHSPDIMIAAPSYEDLRRGNYLFILGEVHLATNTISTTLFVQQHPKPEELFAAIAADFPEPGVTIAPPKHWQNQTLRTSRMLVPPRDYRVELTHDSISPDRQTGVPISEVLIEANGDGLLARTRDGRAAFDVLEIFNEALSVLAINSLKMIRLDRYTPRVTVDRLVLYREAWSFAAGEMEFANEKSSADRFLAARRWARSHALPRFVFVKVPVEVKPVYVDFSSVIYVDLISRLVRRTIEQDPKAQVTVTEMLPGTQETWLPDAEGQTYTSELRVVALDLHARQNRPTART